MPIPTKTTQVCRDCRLELPIAKFSRNGLKTGYRRPECRSCQHLRSKKINPSYLNTPGAVAARKSHIMSQSEVKTIRDKKLKKQQYECVYCNAELKSNSHVDHRTPLARGGTNDSSNLQVLCARCNGEKHSKNHHEYLRWLKENNEHTAQDRDRRSTLFNQVSLH